MEKVLLFFSGGNDSTLSALRLANQGYDVELITFDNGSEEGIEYIRNRATVLENLTKNSEFGKIHNLGVFQSIGSYRIIRGKTLNMSFKEMAEKYGNLNQNQLNCLYCRSAMYIEGIIVAKALGIKHIAEGARKTQMFAIEQQKLLEGYNRVLNNYDMDLMLPVFDEKTDYEVETELYRTSYNFFERVYEAKCWLGFPMNRPLTEEEIDGYSKFFECEVEPLMIESINGLISNLNPTKYWLEYPVYGKIRFKVIGK